MRLLLTAALTATLIGCSFAPLRAVSHQNQFYAYQPSCLPKIQICPQNLIRTLPEREGSGPFASLTPIWIVAVSLFSVAGTGVA